MPLDSAGREKRVEEEAPSLSKAWEESVLRPRSGSGGEDFHFSRGLSGEKGCE